MNLRFSETESAFDYMVATREYIAQHGKPTALYSDRHAVFHVSKRDAQSDRLTQFGRVLNDLNIELICANSSQAKGRVERANKTLQDRLVKEMRLQGIDTIEQANAWLPDFIADFNRRFAKPPRYPKDIHRPVRESAEELDDIFAWQELRKLSKSLTFQYDKVVYLIEPTEENQRLVHQVVKVLDRPDGTIAIQYGRRKLEFKIFDKLADVDQGQVVDNKRLGAVLKFAQAKQEEFEQQQKRGRSKKAPKRTAQQRAIRQLSRGVSLLACQIIRYLTFQPNKTTNQMHKYAFLLDNFRVNLVFLIILVTIFQNFIKYSKEFTVDPLEKNGSKPLGMLSVLIE